MSNNSNSEQVVSRDSLQTAFFLNMPVMDHFMLWCVKYYKAKAVSLLVS